MYPDLQTTRHLLRTGQTHASLEIERAITAAQSARCAHAFVQTSFAQARQTARAPDTASTPLAGLAVSVKDLFRHQPAL
jgi:aspartyl-tRNA(Asn)/glutamyl-tRNA(Gln) amidotransferase subunit A